MAEAPPDPPIPPNLARAFAEAVGMYGVWHPTNPDEQRLSVNGQPRSIAQVCWLVAHFIDRMPEPVARALRSHMDDRYSTLKEKLSENPSYAIGGECLLKLMDDRKADYRERHQHGC
jgi:hypothetical protein